MAYIRKDPLRGKIKKQFGLHGVYGKIPHKQPHERDVAQHPPRVAPSELSQAKALYRAQTKYLAHRGIECTITFDEWWFIWQESGHWVDRGRERGQWQMHRRILKGPYAVGNVYIAQIPEHPLDGNAKSRAREDRENQKHLQQVLADRRVCAAPAAQESPDTSITAPADVTATVIEDEDFGNPEDYAD
jgi:hypothetical protein